MKPTTSTVLSVRRGLRWYSNALEALGGVRYYAHKLLERIDEHNRFTNRCTDQIPITFHDIDEAREVLKKCEDFFTNPKPMFRSTHTYAKLKVSAATLADVEQRIRESFAHAPHEADEYIGKEDGETFIRMNGIALVLDNNPTEGVAVTSIKGCARCGGDHFNVIFSKLTHPVDELTHFAPCPTNGQPILMHFRPFSLLPRGTTVTSADVERLQQDIDDEEVRDAVGKH